VVKELLAMKRILITGSNSYIGNSVKEWLLKREQHYVINEICVKSNEWHAIDFSIYDVVFHVAGIAHSDTGNTSDEMRALYYKVNCDLAVAVAHKAKLSGVKQFIFMSSMIVYGDSAPFGVYKRITLETSPMPTNFYGDSKWQAELRLLRIHAANFKIVIIRPPMVYGKGSKGNYPRLAKLAKKLPLFPKVENERSVIHIDNLCEFIRLMIDNAEDGIFHPQNDEYMQTSDLAKKIAMIHGKKMFLIKFFNPFLRLFARRFGIINKAFGNLSYDLSLSEYKEDYRVRKFEEIIKLTEDIGGS
jgi:UDP-glucose 4-epimerase